jgi:hypothetical protein
LAGILCTMLNEIERQPIWKMLRHGILRKQPGLTQNFDNEKINCLAKD